MILWTNACLAEEQNAAKPSLDIHGSLGFYSDYRFRGISQTQKDLALQGSVEAQHASGFKLNIWGSNVRYTTPDSGSLEVDVTAAYQTQWRDLSSEIGVIYYSYPGSASRLNFDYTEGYVSLGYNFGLLQLNASLNGTSDFFGHSGKAWYPRLGLSAPLPHNFTLEASVARQSIENEVAYGVPDYTDYMLGIRYQWKNTLLSLSYIDTNLNKTQCATGCEASAVFSVVQKF